MYQPPNQIKNIFSRYILFIRSAHHFLSSQIIFFCVKKDEVQTPAQSSLIYKITCYIFNKANRFTQFIEKNLHIMSVRIHKKIIYVLHTRGHNLKKIKTCVTASYCFHGFLYQYDILQPNR